MNLLDDRMRLERVKSDIGISDGVISFRGWTEDLNRSDIREIIQEGLEGDELIEGIHYVSTMSKNRVKQLSRMADGEIVCAVRRAVMRRLKRGA